MVLSKDLFGKIPVTPEGRPVTTRVSVGQKPLEKGGHPKMFMRPREIMSTVSDSVDRMGHPLTSMWNDPDEPQETMAELWKAKEEDDYTPAILESLRRGEAIRHPITMQVVYSHENPENDPDLHMGQGHHRVVAALQHEKETGKPVYIPVVHDTDWNYTDSERYTDDYLNKDLFKTEE